ncbi:hypothetical protein CMI47_16450 [Candidatus Pacearchaeota archaeon]|nr:hypothetical protein [Candidatus Pacearchaeota archaeon]
MSNFNDPYTNFLPKEKVENVIKTQAESMWSYATESLAAFFTGSVQAGNTGKYYWDVYTNNDQTTDVQFSVSYGHRLGLGSEGGTSAGETNPTKAIYSQLRQVLLPAQSTKFNFHGESGTNYYSDDAFSININRARYREKIDPGNWELHLGGHKTQLTGQVTASKGATFVSGSGTQFLTELSVGSTVTISSGSVKETTLTVANIGSDVSMSLDTAWTSDTTTGSAANPGELAYIFKEHPKINLIDDSGASTNPIIGSSKREFWIVSGSIANGVHTTAATTAALGSGSYGLLYPETGMLILNPNILTAETGSSWSVHDQIVFNLGTSTSTNQYNHGKLFSSISGSGYFTARREEQIKTSYYFCKVHHNQYNWSQNPSYFTSSNGQIVNTGFFKDPNSYITTVGLYNQGNELLAVAKLSKPLLKNFNKEAMLTVKLEY